MQMNEAAGDCLRAEQPRITSASSADGEPPVTAWLSALRHADAEQCDVRWAGKMRRRCELLSAYLLITTPNEATIRKSRACQGNPGRDAGGRGKRAAAGIDAGLTVKALSCAARAHVATAKRHVACLHISRAMRAA